MIKINKATNVFGISSINGASTFDKLNVIYAPNGTAKSSIADALKNISAGDSVVDVYGISPAPSYELDIDGNVYNESNMIPFTVIKYCGVENFELNKNDDYSNLVISPSAKSLFSSSIASINSSLANIENILLSSFNKKGRGKTKGQKFSNSFIDSLMVIAGSGDNIILNFALNFKTTLTPLSETLTEDNVLALANLKGKDTILKPEVSSHIATYASITSKKATGSIIDSEFDIDKLNDFSKHIIGDLYFDDNKKRLLKINDNVLCKEDFLEIVKKENLSIYGTDKAKEELEKCRDALNKTAASSKFSSTLLDKPALIKHSLDYITFVNELFVTFLGPKNVNLIETETLNIKKEQSKIASMRATMVVEDNAIYTIWKKFKTRFKFNRYELDIKNRFDAITGTDMPRFVKLQPGTNKEIIDPVSLRFSTGEIRTYNLINFIIEVERTLLLGKPFTIILDDAVDSFDYKNKYGIIDYLIDIKENPLVQLIVLTHNFDFYRSAILSLGDTNQYFMYKDKTANVTLYDVKSKKYYLTVSDFNSWKHTGDRTKYLAFIPFLRNIFQLQTNSHDPRVLDIDKYLHYDSAISDTLNFAIIDPLMYSVNFDFPSSISQTDKYLDILDNVATTISTSPIMETKLEDKILLGIYIRVFLEKFLIKRIESRSGTALSTSNSYARTTSLINRAKSSGYLTDEEFSIVIEANVVSPSYVHANSFMYEPLIDVDSSTLIEVADKIRFINSSI